MSLAKAERLLERAKKRGWSEFQVKTAPRPETPFEVGLTDGKTIAVQHGATTREDALIGALRKAGFK